MSTPSPGGAQSRHNEIY